MGCPRPNDRPLNAKDLADVAEPLRSILHTAIIRAQAEGRTLYLVSGGRSDGQQWDLRHGRVPAGQECNPAYKGVPTTAIPGRSRHRNTGKYENGRLVAAADMGGALSWLHDHQADLGIHFPVPGEAWHAEVTGAKPRWDIIPFGTAANPNGLPAYPGTPLYGGVSHPAVAQWKVMLRFLRYQRFDTKPKGINTFSRGLVAATKRFQKNNGLEVDGIVGPATWAKAVDKIAAIKAKG